MGHTIQEVDIPELNESADEHKKCSPAHRTGEEGVDREEAGEGRRDKGRGERRREGEVPHYLTRPELSPLQCVLQIVSDDVGLLQEQSHGVGQSLVPSYHLTLQTRGREQL